MKNEIAVSGVDVGETCGDPDRQAAYAEFYRYSRERFGFSKRALLLAQSRGGLMLYSWAERNPTAVKAIAGIYPVSDLASWPGVAHSEQNCGGMSTARFQQVLSLANPVDGLAALAKAKISIFHVHGDADRWVPLAQNSEKLVQRYRALGGTAEIEIIKGKGHEEAPEYFRSKRLLDFLLNNR